MEAETIEDVGIPELRPLLARGVSAVSIMGTVRLTEGLANGGKIVYVPAATADPRDPLNMEPWQKIVVVAVVSSFSTIGLSLVSGFGGLIGFYLPQYISEGQSYDSITHLMTYPTLAMAFGNLTGMPVAIAVGRRIVVLCATVLLIVGASLCAMANSFDQHLAARMLIGLAAGQCEAVVPMIIQEIHFLHERSRGFVIQQIIQIIAGTVWVLCASPIAGALSASWWYGLGAVLAGLQFLVSIFFLPETKYDRFLQKHEELEIASNISNTRNPLKCTVRPPLDFEAFPARTWKSDLRLWIGKPEWSHAFHLLKQAAEMFLFPTVFWAICLNGLTLGANIAIATTYGAIITAPPYSWRDSMISFVNCGQIPVALTALPLLGYWSDNFIQWRARRNGGIHEPENRLVPLIAPITIGIFTIVLYGQGAAHPYQYHWLLYIWTVAGYFFTFVGCSIVTTTYLLDSYPARAGPVLGIISICKSIISFAVAYGIGPSIGTIGYDGTFLVFGALTAVLGSLAIPIFIFGKRIRALTGRWIKEAAT